MTKKLLYDSDILTYRLQFSQVYFDKFHTSADNMVGPEFGSSK